MLSETSEEIKVSPWKKCKWVSRKPHGILFALCAYIHANMGLLVSWKHKLARSKSHMIGVIPWLIRDRSGCTTVRAMDMNEDWSTPNQIVDPDKTVQFYIHCSPGPTFDQQPRGYLEQLLSFLSSFFSGLIQPFPLTSIPSKVLFKS